MSAQWRSPKIKRPREQVEDIVQALTEELSDDQPELEFYLCGSYRRGAELVGDLDIVVISESTFTPNLFEPGIRLPSLPRLTYQRRGPRLAAAEFELDDGPLHVDYFQFQPWSRGPALQALTGPASLNIHLRRAAARRRPSLALSQEALKVRDTGQRIEVPDEAAVFEALGLRYETPEERQRWVRA